MKISLHFEPRDLWIGLFWTRKPALVFVPIPGHEKFSHVRSEVRLHLYFCLLPMLVLKVVL